MTLRQSCDNRGVPQFGGWGSQTFLMVYLSKLGSPKAIHHALDTEPHKPDPQTPMVVYWVYIGMVENEMVTTI